MSALQVGDDVWLYGHDEHGVPMRHVVVKIKDSLVYLAPYLGYHVIRADVIGPGTLPTGQTALTYDYRTER